MEKKLYTMKKSTGTLCQVFKVLTILATAFLLWMLAAWVFGLFCPIQQIHAETTASGGWAVSVGPFTVLVRQGYFSPGSNLTSAAKSVYLIESGMNLIGGICQWAVLWFSFLLFDTAMENPFTEKSGRYLRRMGALLCLGKILLEVGKTVLFAAFAGGIWSFFPEGLPVSSILSWMVLWAVSAIFDYGCLLQQEHDETL